MHAGEAYRLVHSHPPRDIWRKRRLRSGNITVEHAGGRPAPLTAHTANHNGATGNLSLLVVSSLAACATRSPLEVAVTERGSLSETRI